MNDTANNIDELSKSLRDMAAEGCTGIAFFVTDSDDPSNEDIAKEAQEHVNAIRAAVFDGEFVEVESLGL